MKIIEVTKKEEELLKSALNYVGNSLLDQLRQIRTIDRNFDANEFYERSNLYFNLIEKIEKSKSASSNSYPKRITNKLVKEVLGQLQQETHYLYNKPVKEWDEYDHSNFKAKLLKAGRIELKDMTE